MTADPIEAKFREIASRVFKKLPDHVGPESRLREDLGADSLDLVVLLHEFEEVFGITVSDEDADGFRTVGDVLEFLRRQSHA